MAPARSAWPGTRARDQRPRRPGGVRRRLLLGVHRLFPVFPVAISDQQRDGGADRFGAAHAGQHFGLIGLDGHAAPAAVAALAAAQLLGDGVEIQVQACRHPFQNHHEPLAVGLAGGEKTQHCSVILYEVSALSGAAAGDCARTNSATSLHCLRRTAWPRSSPIGFGARRKTRA